MDVEAVVDAIQDVHVKLAIEDLAVVHDLGEVKVVTVDGKVPFATCEAHINVDVKFQAKTRSVSSEVDELLRPLLGNAPVDDQILEVHVELLVFFSMTNPSLM